MQDGDPIVGQGEEAALHDSCTLALAIQLPKMPGWGDLDSCGARPALLSTRSNVCHSYIARYM